MQGIFDGILFNHKKEWNHAICSNIDRPTDYHSTWTKTKTSIIWYHLYVEPKKGYKTEIDLQT